MHHHDFINTEKEYETIRSQFPLDVAAYLKIGQLCFMQTDFKKAEKILLASLQVQQTAFANRILGDISIKQKRPEKAIHYYEELSKFVVPPAVSAENAYMLAFAYLLVEKPEPAIRELQQIINRYPAYQPAKELLRKVQMTQNTRPAK
jgi:tetratricopeptide (TPR) repeat protein